MTVARSTHVPSPRTKKRIAPVPRVLRLRYLVHVAFGLMLKGAKRGPVTVRSFWSGSPPRVVSPRMVRHFKLVQALDEAEREEAMFSGANVRRAA